MDTTYVLLCPEADDPSDVFKPLFSGFLWLAERPRISGVAIVLMQELRDKVQILLFECQTPLVNEFDLWGIGAR